VGVDVALITLVAGVAIAVSLLVTPMQEVSAAGQTVQVGVTAPSLSLSGPAELDLFGQSIPTTVTFFGPVRPRLRLTHITVSAQLAEIAGTTTGEEPGGGLQDALVRGFHRYFYWQVAVVAVVTVLLLGAICGWRRRSWRSTLLTLLAGLVVAAGIDLGAIMVTAFSAPAKFGRVHSLVELVGGTPVPTPAPSQPPARPSGDVVVLGDSTAAGRGNPAPADPSAADKACRRSVDSYPVALAQVAGLEVTSLACSGATIAAGILGPQVTRGVTLPPQLGDKSVSSASTVIVSIGANDVRWTHILRLCAASKDCDNAAAQAYFQRHLAQFSTEWLQLVTELRQLPNHPRVLVNLYYDPFAGDVSCLAKVGVTSSKLRSMLSRLAILNSVLGQGAAAAGFVSTLPDFSGHGACDATPYVQGLDAKAPFHPTPAGGLAIALADVQALADTRTPTSTGATN
jgi:lysophospholipase L1-like esterase